ncbi:MAG TPA: hypothetical protein VFN67_22145 [Polyangiales bacterium]|nr:hypothetical protein [Polyangiales bacterium]
MNGVDVARGSRIARALCRMLDAAHADLVIVLLGFVLLLPSLDTGLAADDYLHAVMLDKPCPLPGFARAPLDIFRFGDPLEFDSLFQQGIFSWWDDPHARLAFLRPVSAITHVLDHELFRLNGPMLHLHSALWGLVLLLGVRALFQALIPDRFLANLALALYALDDARGWLVSWVAARNAAVATALSVWTLYVHQAGRSARLHAAHGGGIVGARAAAIWGPVLCMCALLAGEGSVALFGYLVAYALFIERGALEARLSSLAPYAILIVAWRIVYRVYGFGAQGSSLYHDPQADVFAFAWAWLANTPPLLASQLGSIWSDVSMLLFVAPKIELAFYLGSVLFVVCVAWLSWPQLRAEPLSRYGAFGMLAATVPAVSVTPPMDRLLTWISIGGSVLLAQLFAPLLRDPLAQRGVRKLALAGLLGIHVINAFFLPSRARGNIVMRDALRRAEAAIPRDDSVSDKTLVFFNPPLLPYAAYLPIERAASGVPRPRLQHIISSALTEINVERLDQYTLRLTQREGFIRDPISRLMWSKQRPFHRGERIVQSDMILTVNELTEDQRPLSIDIHFARPLEDPSYLWVQWRGTRSEPFVPPRIGEQVVLPAADYIQSVLGKPQPFELRY